jgi:hypothetical protein
MKKPETWLDVCLIALTLSFSAFVFVMAIAMLGMAIRDFYR